MAIYKGIGYPKRRRNVRKDKTSKRTITRIIIMINIITIAAAQAASEKDRR